MEKQHSPVSIKIAFYSPLGCKIVHTNSIETEFELDLDTQMFSDSFQRFTAMFGKDGSCQLAGLTCSATTVYE